MGVTQVVSGEGSHVFGCGLRKAIQLVKNEEESRRLRTPGPGVPSPHANPSELPWNDTRNDTLEPKAPESSSMPGGEEHPRISTQMMSRNVPAFWDYPGPLEAEAGVLMTVFHSRTGRVYIVLLACMVMYNAISHILLDIPKVQQRPLGYNSPFSISVRQLLRRTFDTSQFYASWADLVWFLSQVTEGHILVLTLRSGAAGLRFARDVLVSWGSQLVEFAGVGSLWTWVKVKGGKTIVETLVKEVMGHVPKGTNLMAEGVLELSTISPPKSTSQLETSRWEICESHGGLAGLCDETTPDILQWHTPPISGIISKVPVVITVGNRLQYLYHSLHQLLQCPGASREKIIAVVDSLAPEVVQKLLDLLGIESVRVHIEGTKNFKLFQYYRSVFQLAANRFPQAPAVIFMDEDIYLSPDSFNFLNQTLGLLQIDPSLYCVTLSSETKKGRGAHYVHRIASQVNWGYAVTPSFIQEALRLWPTNSSNASILLYDYWLYEVVRGDRECLVPDVRRSCHYGLGVNTNKVFHERSAWGFPLLADSGVQLRNLHQVTLREYEQLILEELRKAYVLGPRENPCRSLFSSRLLGIAKGRRRSFVLYYRKRSSEDIKSWYLLGRCTGFFAGGKQGHHRGVHIAHYPLQREKGKSDTNGHNNNTSDTYRHLGRNNGTIWNITELATRASGNIVHKNGAKNNKTLQDATGSRPLPTVLDMKNSIAFHTYSEDAHTSPHKDTDDYVSFYLVGVPFSFYSSSRPKGAYVFDVNHISDELHDGILSTLDDTVESLHVKDGESFDVLKLQLFVKDANEEF
ncbi:protein O-linked-mannose beta-1,2-N-acetylglucosaminyltransferase 1-like [Oratosquilla oratoria]|uniref:protein O-linked-mannose beta-1,2-N-acetylglucosaminyltransferase 1-like n=1 Tax=Oratosquilla oratoria TaxID=337810 RepID=UPI003F75C559